MNATNKQTSDVALKLQRAGAPATSSSFEVQCGEWFKSNQKRLANLWGSEDNAKRLLLVAMESVNKNPFLLKCTFESFGRALLTCSELKLYPGAMQEAALVPMKNGKTGHYEVNFWPQYQGLVKLAHQGGFIKSIQTEVVYENDDFDFQLGTNCFLKHRPYLGDADRGKRHAVYCCIETLHGTQITVLPMSFIEGIKKRSPAARSGMSPWNGSSDDFDAMAKKTALRQALKLIPKSTELATAMDRDSTESNLDFSGAVSVAIQDVVTTANEEKEGERLGEVGATQAN